MDMNLTKQLSKMKFVCKDLSELSNTLSQLRDVVMDDVDENLKYVISLRRLIYDMEDLIDRMDVVLRANEKIESTKTFMERSIEPIIIRDNMINVGEQIDNLMQEMNAVKRGSELDNKSKIDYSYLVSGDLLIGRDGDKESLVKRLVLNNNADRNSDFSFVTVVVGMGGLGKTTLAKHVYHDERISKHFELKMWACVGHRFDLRSIASQLLGREVVDPEPEFQIRQTIARKRFLIVLDDVWSENSSDWIGLDKVLYDGAVGSKVLVTTRSTMVAEAINNVPVYNLARLSDDDSWHLFKTVAFQPNQLVNDSQRVMVGMKIVKKCGNLPLAITTVGGLLLGQSITKWLLFMINSLSTRKGFADRVLSVLKISYRHLPTRFKRCFTHFSVFPKGYVIEKDTLISMWMAEGYLSGYAAQDADVGEECFMTLVNRGFMQPVKQYDCGEIISCKLHDFMHDLAVQIAGEDFTMVSSFTTSKVTQQTRHLALADDNIESVVSLLSKIRKIHTFLNFSNSREPNQFNSDWVCRSELSHLKVLELGSLDISSLPDALGVLIHLKYLSYSSSMARMLPSSVSNLYNLQTLILRECLKLNHIPNLNKHTQLRHLDLFGCNGLTHMPSGMHTLTSLTNLPVFVVGGESWGSVSKQLEGLKTLANLKGNLTIRFLNSLPFYETESMEEGYLSTKKHLKGICIQLNESRAVEHKLNGDHDVALLDLLEPPISCERLTLIGYHSVRFPSWGIRATQNLVVIRFENCTQLQHLPPLSHLRHLRVLSLHRLENLEYVGDNSVICGAGTLKTASPLISLQKLTLSCLSKLKGWWRGIEKGKEAERDYQQLTFPRLSNFIIHECPRLVSLPLCPNVQELELSSVNPALPLILFTNHPQPLKRVRIDVVEYLNYLPMESYQHLSRVVIHLSDVESFSTNIHNEVFKTHLPSLEFLQIMLCHKLKSLSGLGWMHLTLLKKLCLSNLSVLNLDITAADNDAGEGVMPWKCLSNLHSLELDFLPKMVYLPLGIQYLTALQTLEIRSCHSLKELPDSLSCLVNLRFLSIEACLGLECLPQSMCQLTSLLKLEILGCSSCLRKRCEHPSGEDWPKIQHIPHVCINQLWQNQYPESTTTINSANED